MSLIHSDCGILLSLIFLENVQQSLDFLHGDSHLGLPLLVGCDQLGLSNLIVGFLDHQELIHILGHLDGGSHLRVPLLFSLFSCVSHLMKLQDSFIIDISVWNQSVS